MNTNHNLKKLLIPLFLLALAVVVLWGVFTYLNSGYLVITTNGNSAAKATIEPIDGSSTSKIDLKPGQVKKVMVHKGSYRVSAESGDIKSIDLVDVKGKLAKTAITVPIGEIHAIKKLGSSAEYCPLFIQNATYSYDCQTDHGLVIRHMPIGATSGGLMFDGQVFGFLRPYQNGLLGFGSKGDDTDYSKIIYLDIPSNSVQTVGLSSEVSNLLKREVPQVVTPTDTTKSYFALSFKKADKTFLFKGISDGAPILIDLKVKTSEAGRLSSFSFNNDQLVFFAGTQEASHEEGEGDGESFNPDADTSTQGANLESYFFDYNLDGKLASTVKLPKSFQGNNGTKLIENYYVVNTRRGIEVYYKDGEKVRIVSPAYDIGSWVIIGGKLYTQQNGTIYEFKPGANGYFSMHSLFTSTGIRTSQLFYSQSGLIFTGFAKRSQDDKLDIYRLLDEKKTTAPLEEAMPYSQLSGLILDYDYDDTTIQFTPLVITGSTYESSLNSITAAIHAMHIDTGGRQLQLAPIVMNQQ